MNMFQVRIGRSTRRGGFEELVNKAVQAPDSVSESRIREYFLNKYSGLDVVVLRAITVEDLTEALEKPVLVAPQERVLSYIPNVEVHLTPEEEALFEDYSQAMKTARDKEGSLIRKIKERFCKFPYVRETDYNEFEIEISQWDVVIKKLPIKARGIVEAALKNESGMEENNEA
ncbi:MAG: hypothetical protein LBQ88_21565 [Treponema sp.]|jgi:hypothetical protein|nr:hypothetical protein [Treponema sp.]